ncbi:MAG: hypothetical protein QXY52_00305 [Conexivisphaerales archaeon]
MKILDADYRSKSIKLRLDNEDDLWDFYNFLYKDDDLIGRTTREIKTNDTSYRRSVTVRIKVEWAEMQPMSSRLRVHGIITDCPDDIEIKGKHHTINLDQGSIVTVVKENSWNQPDINRIKEAEKRTRINLTIISVDNEEVAVAKVTNSGMSILMQKAIDLRVKGHPDSNENKKKGVITEVAEEISKIVDGQKPDFIALAGPSMLKNEFLEGLKPKLRNREIISVDTSYGGVAGINEALKRDTLNKAIKNLQVLEEISIMEEFNARISKNLPVSYGIDNIEIATNFRAIEYLFVLSSMLNDPLTRDRVIKVMDDVEKKGGNVKIFTSDINARAWLKSFGGIAAFLRFAVQ